MSALRIVDADGHIREEVGEVQEYLDPPLAGRKFFFPLWPVTADSEVRGFIRHLRSLAGLSGLYGRGRDRQGCALSNPRSIPWTDSRSGVSSHLREAEELGCALAIHGSPQSGLGLEVFDRHIEAHVLSHPLPIAMHCISIVWGE